MIVLKIIGGIILIISAVLYFFYSYEVVRKEQIEKYDSFIGARFYYGFCITLLCLACILLIKL